MKRYSGGLAPSNDHAGRVTGGDRIRRYAGGLAPGAGDPPSARPVTGAALPGAGSSGAQQLTPLFRLGPNLGRAGQGLSGLAGSAGPGAPAAGLSVAYILPLLLLKRRRRIRKADAGAVDGLDGQPVTDANGNPAWGANSTPASARAEQAGGNPTAATIDPSQVASAGPGGSNALGASRSAPGNPQQGWSQSIPNGPPVGPSGGSPASVSARNPALPVPDVLQKQGVQRLSAPQARVVNQYGTTTSYLTSDPSDPQNQGLLSITIPHNSNIQMDAGVDGNNQYRAYFYDPLRKQFVNSELLADLNSAVYQNRGNPVANGAVYPVIDRSGNVVHNGGVLALPDGVQVSARPVVSTYTDQDQENALARDRALQHLTATDSVSFGGHTWAATVDTNGNYVLQEGGGAGADNFKVRNPRDLLKFVPQVNSTLNISRGGIDDALGSGRSVNAGYGSLDYDEKGNVVGSHFNAFPDKSVSGLTQTGGGNIFVDGVFNSGANRVFKPSAAPGSAPNSTPVPSNKKGGVPTN